jgi:hypothetical protein
MLDAAAKGLMARGEKAFGAKLNEEKVRQIRALEGTDTKTAIAKRFGVSRSNIDAVLKGKLWKHVAP